MLPTISSLVEAFTRTEYMSNAEELNKRVSKSVYFENLT